MVDGQPTKHPYFPQVTYGEDEITASLEVNTGVDDLAFFEMSIREASISANEESILSWQITSGNNAPSVLVTIYVWKGGTNHGDAGDSAITVAWRAEGK